MRTARRIEIALGVFGLCTTLAFAQAPGGPPPGGAGGLGAPPQGGPGGRGGHRGGRSHPKFPLLVALDVNGDEILDAGELTGARAALLTLDQNGDGKLTREEYLPARPEGEGGAPGMGGPGGEGAPEFGAPKGESSPETGGRGGKGGRGGGRNHPLVKALDANGDGILDAGEIARASSALKSLDANGDGLLSGEELHPARPEGEGPGGPPSTGPEEQGRASAPTGRSGYGSGATRTWAPKSAAGVPSSSATEEAPWAAQATAPSVPATAATPETAPAAPAGAETLSVTGVAAFSNPLRLTVSGEGFQAGCTVQVNGRPVPSTTCKGSHMAVASGAGLEGMLPKGSPVHIAVVNPDGTVSPPLLFTR